MGMTNVTAVCKTFSMWEVSSAMHGGACLITADPHMWLCIGAHPANMTQTTQHAAAVWRGWVVCHCNIALTTGFLICGQLSHPALCMLYPAIRTAADLCKLRFCPPCRAANS